VNNCFIQRRWTVERVFPVGPDETKTIGYDLVTGPCRNPTTRAICPACRSGWQVQRNFFTEVGISQLRGEGIRYVSPLHANERGEWHVLAFGEPEVLGGPRMRPIESVYTRSQEEAWRLASAMNEQEEKKES
jgi:hypothetical protein